MIWEILVTALIVIGATFGLIGSFGMVKLRDPLQRLHAPSKATTIGVGVSLVAAVIELAIIEKQQTWQELLVVMFLFATTPITALYLAKVNIHRTVDRTTLPPTGVNTGWSTLAEDPAQPPKDS